MSTFAPNAAISSHPSGVDRDFHMRDRPNARDKFGVGPVLRWVPGLDEIGDDAEFIAAGGHQQQKE